MFVGTPLSYAGPPGGASWCMSPDADRARDSGPVMRRQRVPMVLLLVRGAAVAGSSGAWALMAAP